MNSLFIKSIPVRFRAYSSEQDRLQAVLQGSLGAGILVGETGK